MTNHSTNYGLFSIHARHSFLTVLFSIIALMAVNTFASAYRPLVRNQPTVAPSAKFDRIWVDYDVTEGSIKGMRIHVKFTVYGMKNLDSYLAIYFETAAGERLKDKNKKFNSSTGDVAVYRSMAPGYDPTDYEDLAVFMPYDELDLSDGNWDLRLDVDIIYKAGGMIQHLTYKEINYKQGDAVGGGRKNSGSISATLQKVWIDYDVTENGVKGMRIHLKVQVKGLKGIDSEFAVRVQKKDGTYLSNSRSSFSNSDGQLRLLYEMKPGYDPAVFEDAAVFLPYNEINVGTGKWDLKLDMDLNYEGGELIQHLDYYAFEFTR